VPAARSVVIHGHFYQPPREEPWLEEVEIEPSAAPAHDWNQRIEQECYRAVAAARIPAADGRISRIVNTLEWISFNAGPTLLEWMERRAPATYEAFLGADRASARRLGHGNALAMPYHHVILPLCSPRDRLTEIRWGMADFRRRFGREPEGMWLPETAVDDATLDALAGEGIRFTILAPHQVQGAPADGSPGVYRTGGGRRIVLCPYDGALAHDVAFGPLVRDAQRWYDRMAVDDDVAGRRLVSLACDGETWGHHHHFGEMALAQVLDGLNARPDVTVENFASWLARHPATADVGLVAPSSWSCTHGVDRWRRDCGCKVAPERSTSQAWREPLRQAIDWLAAELHARFDERACAWFADPAAARDRYGSVVGAEPEALSRLVREMAGPGTDQAGWTRAAEWLEIERGALRSQTSCAWFFDDIAGIEAGQVLRYAARAIALAGADAPGLAIEMARRLEPAVSNDHSAGTGRELFLRHLRPEGATLAWIAAGLVAAAELAPECPPPTGYRVEIGESGWRLVHRRTGRRHDFEADLRAEGVSLVVRISAPWLEMPAIFSLEGLPEAPREAVRAALRTAIVLRWFTPDELAGPAEGRLSAREESAAALGRAVRALQSDRGAEAIRRVLDLASLFASYGRSVPFEVQTAFYHVQQSASDLEQRLLAPVARALGFSTRPLP
jgi:hypothetical protein